MPGLRSSIPDFQLANPIYIGATATFFEVDINGIKTATLATLYAGPTGSTTARNPQTLDGDGKFEAPVYIADAVIAEISGASVASHDTGVIQVRGTYKGNYLAGTIYSSSDLVRDSLTGDVYVVTNDYLAVSLAADITAENLIIMVEISPISAVATAAAAAAAASAAAAAASASSASNAEMPTVPAVHNYVRRNAGNTQYENRTPLQMNDDAAVVAANISSAQATDLTAMTGRTGNLTGGATITSFVTGAAGVERELTLTGAPTFTHHATDLILPGGVNIVGGAGDIIRLRSLGANKVICTHYLRANGGLTFNTVTQPTLVLKQSAAPAPTVEGDAQWDTDDNALAIGDGAATKIIPTLPASVVAGDLFYATSDRVLARIPKGAAGQRLRMNPGATAPEWGGGIGAVAAATSGVAIDFTSIPDGTRRITVSWADLSTSGTSTPIIQIGDSGGIEATGYLGTAGHITGSDTTNTAANTTGFRLAGSSHAAANVLHGSMVLTLIDPATFTWVASMQGSRSDTTIVTFGAGSKSLSAALDRVRLTTLGGTDTFDAGKVNILYE
ncbi:hypothetical protein [Mesorhizobium onobrychidis]|uniref:Uncharacterized protein n=1 Tax=Mesorhizobium onobrychidis TaxID=2775404 RepID=A0ABY5QU32_9HYPH|nr:hypothetical protein [Mesorhizobium onobrychidis]UVC14705.1 hypothetical protein IHQ72_29500 [Mesorhizobium onobrychidis]